MVESTSLIDGSMKECRVCGNSVLPHNDLCNPCREQKEQMEKRRKQKLRDEAFGSLWDGLRGRRE